MQEQCVVMAWMVISGDGASAPLSSTSPIEQSEARSTIWSAPGSMDTKESGCSMRPEVRNESGEETAEELYA